MHDLLVSLAAPPPVSANPHDVTIRKVHAAEIMRVTAWIEQHFLKAWGAEFLRAHHQPQNGAFIAVMENTILGFACYDGAAKGVFGPTGVVEQARRGGIGRSLLRHCLHDMKAAGYVYAIIGAAGPVDYYVKEAGAMKIKGGSPGFLRDLLK